MDRRTTQQEHADKNEIIYFFIFNKSKKAK